MRTIRLSGVLLMMASFFMLSCDPNDGNGSSSGSNFDENFGSTAARDFIGQVVDTDNHALPGVTIKIGSSSAMTDANGVFMIDAAEVHEHFAYVTAEKTGYINGSRSLVPTSGRNGIKIMMIPSTPVGTVSSGSQDEIALASGTKVVFDGAFEDENGNTYSGNVSVAMYQLMPSNDDISALMPGMLYAEDESGDEKMLETFGMMNVELRGSGGQKLNIADGHTAQVEMIIDASQAGTAPQTIPLWHFDEAKGYWKEDGVATKQGNKYVGEVSHFSWWNCDVPANTITLTMNIQNSGGDAISNVRVDLIRAGSIYPRSGTSDDNGQISGLVPANETLTMNIYDSCGGLISTSTIGPFSSDTTLPTIVLASSMIQSTVVEGVLVNCTGANVTQGYVIMNYGNTFTATAVSSGAFSFTALVCPTSNSFTLEGFDYGALQTTGEIAYTFTSPLTMIGNLSACTAVDEFISYQLGGDNPVYIFTNITAGASANGAPGQGLSILGYNQGEQNYINMTGGGVTAPGIYAPPTFSFYVSGMGTSMSNMTVNVSAYGAVGQYIDVTFYGTLTDSVGNPTPLTGVAHVIRDN
jgi:hypothetical protein